MFFTNRNALKKVAIIISVTMVLSMLVAIIAPYMQ